MLNLLKGIPSFLHLVISLLSKLILEFLLFFTGGLTDTCLKLSSLPLLQTDPDLFRSYV